ncbi:MAG: hypothetical protein AAF628_14740 [Planctomycetota bacterium]
MRLHPTNSDVPPGDTVVFLAAPVVGPGPFLPGGMLCLFGPLGVFGTALAPFGDASIAFPLPPVLPGPHVTLATQAVALPSWCMSNTITARLYN